MNFLSVFLLLSISNLTAQTIRINEVVSSNSIHTDVDGDTPDWLELHNYGTQDVSIHNWSLTDDEADLTQWTFPDITLAPDQYLLIWASDKDRLSEINDLHTNFKISSSSETLTLTNISGTVVDQITAENLSPDTSIGVSTNSGNLVVFLETTPGDENSNNEFQGTITSQVVFSQEGGLLNGPISLILSGNAAGEEIRYTIGGNAPTATSTLYTSPIQINANTSVRAQIFSENYIPSAVYTKSYILNANHEIDVILLTTAPENLFDEDTGIYVLGPNGDPSYPNTGANFWKDWERPMHFAYYENGVNTFVEFNAGVKIQGGASRTFAQRSLALFARSQYGDSEFEHSFFDELSYTTFESLVLRNSGNDWLKSSFKDVMISSLMRGSGLDFQEHTPVATYINGEYWGKYNLREKVNEHMLASKHGLDADDITILEFNGQEVEGDNTEYRQLIDYISSTDLSNDSNFEHVAQEIDLEEYALYQATQIYVNNTDWPGNNIKYWKHSEGKWRWIMYDTDFGFRDNWSNNTLEYALSETRTGQNPTWSTLLFRKLITNIGFRNMFINRYADELNTRFLPSKVKAHIDNIHAATQPEIDASFLRWGRDPARAVRFANEMKNFADNRPTVVKDHIKSKFGLPAYHPITINNPETSEGFVEVNSNLNIQETSWVGDYFETVPIQLAAMPLVGFEFSHWSGDISSTDQTISVTLEGNLVVTPNFVPTNANDPIVINEINYKSSDSFDADDWVELYNPNESSIDLSNWQLKDDDDSHSFVVPEGTSIEAGGYIVLVKTAEDFNSVYPDITNIVGDIDFGFGGSDAVRLFDANSLLQDEVVYLSEAPWSDCADETGNTLELIALDLDNALPESWNCINTNGSPGRSNDSAPIAQDPIAMAGSDQEITLPTSSITFNGSGNDPDGGTVSYLWTQLSGNTANLSGANTENLTASALTEGSYTFELTVTDDEGATAADQVTVVVNPEPVESTFALRINTGGPQTTYNGEVYMADQYFDTGNTLDRPQTGLPQPYRTIRYSPSQVMNYDIPIDDGQYTVKLHFAEVWFGATGGGSGGVGSRVFDIRLESELVEDNLDVFAQAGGAQTMLIKQYTVTVSGGILNVDFNATDAVGGERHPIINAIEILGSAPVAQDPIATAGSNQEITLPTSSITFNGSGNDPDGGTVSYLWTQLSGNTANLSGANTENLTASALTEGSYTFELTVTDDEGATAADQVTVVVNPEVLTVQDPIAMAGSDQEITLPTSSITFNGLGNDPDGGTVSYLWTQLSGNTANLSGANTENLTASALTEGSYTFELTVTDDEGATAADQVTVVVNPEPVESTFALRINTGGSLTTYNGEVYMADQYFDTGNTLDRPQTGLPQPYRTIRYSPSQVMNYDIPIDDGQYTVKLHFAEVWFGATGGGSGGVGSRVFDIRLEGELVEDNLDVFAQAGGAQTMLIKQYTVTVSGGILNIDFNATDAVGGERHPIINAIEILGSAPVAQDPIATAGSNQEITLPTSSITFNGSGNDPDGGTVSYLWTQLSGNTANLSGANTENLTASALTEGSYTFELTVTDDEGATAADQVTVVVNPEVLTVQDPIAMAGSDQEITLPTSSITFNGLGNDPDGGTVSYLWTQLSGNTANLSGANTENLTASALTEGSYTFELTVTDDEGATAADQVTVVVNPEPVESTFALRINTGGSLTTYNGEVYMADQYFDTGNTLDRPQTGLPQPYRTIRYSPSQVMNYDIPIDDGQYTVKLHFAEVWFGATGGGSGGVGSRVFDIRLEGELVEDNLDVFAQAGGAQTMLIKQYTVTVSGGILNIDFNATDAVGGERHPIINAIEILSTNTSSLAARLVEVNPSILTPNPAITETTLSFEKTVELTTIQIYDVAGRLVHLYNGPEVADEGNYLLQIGDLESGTYFISSYDVQGVKHLKQMVVIKR